MRNTETLSVECYYGDADVTLQAVGGLRAGKLLVKLSRILSPALGELSLGEAGVPAAAAKLFENLSEGEFESLLKDFLDGAVVRYSDADGRPQERVLWPVINDLFQGTSLSLIPLLAAALKLNYGNFSNALSLAAKQLGLSKMPMSLKK